KSLGYHDQARTVPQRAVLMAWLGSRRRKTSNPWAALPTVASVRIDGSVVVDLAATYAAAALVHASTGYTSESASYYLVRALASPCTCTHRTTNIPVVFATGMSDSRKRHNGQQEYQ